MPAADASALRIYDGAGGRAVSGAAPPRKMMPLRNCRRPFRALLAIGATIIIVLSLLSNNWGGIHDGCTGARDLSANERHASPPAYL